MENPDKVKFKLKKEAPAKDEKTSEVGKSKMESPDKVKIEFHKEAQKTGQKKTSSVSEVGKSKMESPDKVKIKFHKDVQKTGQKGKKTPSVSEIGKSKMESPDKVKIKFHKDDEMSLASETDQYPLPSNQDYMSYYVYQGEWRPTKPLRPVGAEYASPGPAIVNLPPTIGSEGCDPSRPRAPSYKMGERLKYRDQGTFGPGPGAYDVNSVCKVTNQGKYSDTAPKIGTAKRFDDKLDDRSPGPAAYNRDAADKIVFPGAPAYTMRHSERGKTKIPFVPAPNAYTLPSAIGSGKSPFVTGPSYSMGKAERTPDVRLDQNPGPAAYMLPSTNVNMAKSPGFYMGHRIPFSYGISASPGPAAYSSHLTKFDKYSTPRITFGIRHTPYQALPGFAAEN